MKKKKKKIERAFLYKDMNQREITTGLSTADIREMLSMEYGEGVVSLTVTTPPTLLGKIMNDVTLSKVNRSLAISYLLHQGLTRYKEKFEVDNKN